MMNKKQGKDKENLKIGNNLTFQQTLIDNSAHKTNLNNFKLYLQFIL